MFSFSLGPRAEAEATTCRCSRTSGRRCGDTTCTRCPANASSSSGEPDDTRLESRIASGDDSPRGGPPCPRDVLAGRTSQTARPDPAPHLQQEFHRLREGERCPVLAGVDVAGRFDQGKAVDRLRKGQPEELGCVLGCAVPGIPPQHHNRAARPRADEQSGGLSPSAPHSPRRAARTSAGGYSSRSSPDLASSTRMPVASSSITRTSQSASSGHAIRRPPVSSSSRTSNYSGSGVGCGVAASYPLTARRGGLSGIRLVRTRGEGTASRRPVPGRARGRAACDLSPGPEQQIQQ